MQVGLLEENVEEKLEKLFGKGINVRISTNGDRDISAAPPLYCRHNAIANRRF